MLQSSVWSRRVFNACGLHCIIEIHFLENKTRTKRAPLSLSLFLFFPSLSLTHTPKHTYTFSFIVPFFLSFFLSFFHPCSLKLFLGFYVCLILSLPSLLFLLPCVYIQLLLLFSIYFTCVFVNLSLCTCLIPSVSLYMSLCSCLFVLTDTKIHLSDIF